MPEAVIVATGRTPIGRANKGSLIECRPDDLSALVIGSVLEKLPQLDPTQVEDVILGCGQPAGEAGYNVARVAAILAGLENVPGVTVNRYCSSSPLASRRSAATRTAPRTPARTTPPSRGPRSAPNCGRPQ